MKKNILKAFLIVAIISIASYKAYSSQQQENEISDLTMANIEALASGESGSRHTLDCGKAGIKACSATCNKCNVTLTSYGNGGTVELICYQ